MSSVAYRPDIDGLRAVAVVLVLLFHGGLGFGGGYIGVDVFFVISGYLIASVLLRELEQGRFSLMEFWERRARRILPALSITVLATLLAGWFLLLPRDLNWLARSALAQAVMAANFYFQRNTNYFSGDVEEMPLLHTWSLAVEEQFYLFFPFLLLLFRKSWGKKRLLGVVAFLGLGSLSLSFYSVIAFPTAAFYLLPSRAWELLAGVGLAIRHFQQPARLSNSGIGREAASFVSIAAIVLPAVLYDETTPFPGLAALPPVLGAMGIIHFRGGLVHRALSWRPVVSIGLISYSLYLWHWPLLAFANYWSLADRSAVSHRVGLLLASVVLAAISFRWIETPFRKKNLFASRNAIYGFAAASTFLVMAASACLIFSRGAPQRLPSELAPVVAVYAEDVHFDRQTEDEVRSGSLPFVGKERSEVRFLIWGDSHAQAALPAFREFASEISGKGYYVTNAATAPICGAYFPSNFGLNQASLPLADAIIEFVTRESIPDVFLVAYWSLYQSKDAERLRAGLAETISQLHNAGTRVWVVMDVPTHHAPVPKALAKGMLFGGAIEEAWCRPAEHYARNRILYELSREASTARYIDPAQLMRRPSTDDYEVARENKPFYFDHQHLSKEGSKRFVLPLLLSECGPVMRGNH